MRKYFSFLSIILLAFIITNNQRLLAYDYYANCDLIPDCDWIEQDPVTFMCGTCEVWVVYSTRICTGGNWDGVPHYQIHGIYSNDPLCDVACTSGDALGQAGLAILMKHMTDPSYPPGQNPWLPTGPNDCNLTMHGYQAACYYWFKLGLPSGGQQQQLQPCNLESCCRVIWWICNDAQGNPQLPPQILGYHNVVPCGPEEFWNDCQTNCGN